MRKFFLFFVFLFFVFLFINGCVNNAGGSEENKTENIENTTYPAYHYECIDEKCTVVSGPGVNFPDCTIPGKPCKPPPPPQYHYECMNYMCVLVEGPGENGSCTKEFDPCGPRHFECMNLKCTIVFGDGENYTQCESEGQTCGDIDEDGIGDEDDNCINISNSNQSDADGDGVGDACDICPLDVKNDEDGDGVCGNADNCPAVYNPKQEDGDRDGKGNYCDSTPVNCEWVCPASPYELHVGVNLNDSECIEKAEGKANENGCEKACVYVLQRGFEFGENKQTCCCAHIIYVECNCSTGEKDCPKCPEYPE